jgi:rhodanese-related sulfurtransferase
MKEAIEICPTTTLSKVKEGALLLDVREPKEVAELAYDVPNILNIPISEFETRFTEIPRDSEIVMVCRGGSRSLRTTYFLMNNDYPNVSNMSGGIVKWVDKGFPTIGNVNSVTENVQAGGCCGTSANDSGESCC